MENINSVEELQRFGQKVFLKIQHMLDKEGLKLPELRKGEVGIIGGQSVATLFLEEIGFSNYREKIDYPLINDIDLFIIKDEKEYNPPKKLSCKVGREIKLR
jgi:hypothetical protein